MAPVIWTDLDRLILDRWGDVIEFRQALQSVELKIAASVAEVGRRVEVWAKDQGYQSNSDVNDAGVYIYRPEWVVDENALVWFVVGSIAPRGFRKVTDHFPFIGVYLLLPGVNGPAREQFAYDLQAEWGPLWASFRHDPEEPQRYALLEYLQQVDAKARETAILDPEALFTLVRQQFERLLPLTAGIDARLKAVQAAVKV
jgi:hypothetical protein